MIQSLQRQDHSLLPPGHLGGDQLWATAGGSFCGRSAGLVLSLVGLVAQVASSATFGQRGDLGPIVPREGPVENPELCSFWPWCPQVWAEALL